MRLRTSRDEQQEVVYPRFGLQGRTRFVLAALMAPLPDLDIYAAGYLISSRAASWIGPSDYALLEESLARGLGL